MADTTDADDSVDRGSRHRLYEVMDDTELSLSEKQQRALALGREHLGVEHGHIQKRNPDGETDTVVASDGADPELLPAGTTLDRATTYCRRVVDKDSPVALSDAPSQGWADDPAYRKHGLDCYLGTTIFVHGDVYGTVCFSSRTPRDGDFTSGEMAFVELVARLLGREIEAVEHEQRIARTERERDRSANKYEALLDLAPDAIFLADAETGEIVGANEQAADLTGYTKAQLEEMTVFDVHPGEKRERYERLFGGAVDESLQDRFEDGTPLEIRRSDGTDVPVEISATTIELADSVLMQGIVRDISDRRDRERELRVKDRALEEASVGITIADATTDDQPLVYVNREFERLTGYDREEVLGENCRFLQGPETAEKPVADVREALAARERVQTELLNYRDDGIPFWNELTVAPVTGANGDDEVTHFVGVQQDITARKRRDRSLEVLDRVFRHNLRNTVSVIEGYAGTIAEQSDGDIAAMAREITRASGDLTTLSEKVRDLQTAMMDPQSLQAREIVSDVESVVDSLRTTYSDATFVVSAPEEVQVMAPARLRLALTELVDNAAKHAEAPTVTVDVEVTDGGRVTVAVRDTGPGLSECEQQVLERGHETTLEHGDGLGLWLVNWIVTDAGGDVTVTVDGGTTVELRLLTPERTALGRSDAYRQAALGTHTG